MPLAPTASRGRCRLARGTRPVRLMSRYDSDSAATAENILGLVTNFCEIQQTHDRCLSAVPPGHQF